MAQDPDVAGARLDRVEHAVESAPAAEPVDARGSALGVAPEIDQIADAGLVLGRLDHGAAGQRRVNPRGRDTVQGDPAADERRDRRVAAERDGTRHDGVEVVTESLRADVAEEVHGARVHLVEEPGQTRQRLPHPLQRQLGHALQLDRALGREVLIPVGAPDEIPVRPRLGEEQIRLGALGAARQELGLVLPQHEVVGHRVEIGAEREPRVDLPVVLGAAQSASVTGRHTLVHEEPAERAALVARDHVPVLGRAADAPSRVGVEAQGRVLAVGDRPVERDLGEDSLARGGAELRRQEARLTLATDGRREEREVRDQRHVLQPEGGVGAVDEVLEVGGARADAERPRRRVVVTGGEDAAPHPVDALAEPLQTLAHDPVVGRGPRLALVHHAGPGLDVVVDPLAGEPVLAVVEDHPALRGRVAGRAVDLDAVGEQTGRPLGQLGVAARHHEVVGADLLDPVGHHRDFAAGGQDRRGGRRCLRGGHAVSQEGAREEEDRRPESRHEKRSPMLSAPRSSEQG